MRGPVPRWTDAEIVVLCEANKLGIKDKDIAKMLRRSKPSIIAKRKGMCWPKPAKPKPEPIILPPQPAISSILAAVADFYDLDLIGLLSERRERCVARPRQVAMYLCRKLTRHSLTTIARKFHRDHTTLIHGVSQIETLIGKDWKIQRAVNLLEKSIKSKLIPRFPHSHTCSGGEVESIEYPMEQQHFSVAA